MNQLNKKQKGSKLITKQSHSVLYDNANILPMH